MNIRFFIKVIVVIYLFIISAVEVNAAQKNIEDYLKLIEKAYKEQNLPNMINYYEEMLAVYDELKGDKELKPKYMYEYGMYLTYSGSYDKAIKTILNVIKLIEGNDNQKEIRARCSMQLGLIYFFQEQWDTALEHYLRAEKLATDINNKMGQSIAKNNIGNIYQKKKRFEEAIEQYNETLELQKEIRDSATICNTLYNLGSCYRLLNDSKRAEQYFKDAHKIAEIINDSEIVALSLIEMGIMAENAEWIEQSIDMVRRSGHKQVLCEAYSVNAELKVKLGDYKAAFYNAKQAAELSDSLFKAETVRQLNDFSVKYKTKEYESEIAIYKMRIKYIIIIALLSSILITIVYRIQRKSNNRLKEINMLKDRFMRVVSHDIKNPLISQKMLLELMVNNMDCLKYEDIKNQCDDLLRSSGALLNLLNNLLNWSQIESKTLPYNPTKIDLFTLVKEIEEIFHITLHQKNIVINSNVEPQSIAYGDFNMILTILRNLIFNALKYSHINSSISLEV